jgi:hypothetical protein
VLDVVKKCTRYQIVCTVGNVLAVLISLYSLNEKGKEKEMKKHKIVLIDELPQLTMWHIKRHIKKFKKICDDIVESEGDTRENDDIRFNEYDALDYVIITEHLNKPYVRLTPALYMDLRNKVTMAFHAVSLGIE